MERFILDELDRRLVHALQIDARASFGRIGEVLGASDRTLARRYRRLRAAGLVRVVGVVSAAALDESEWLVRMRCLPDVAAGLADVLAARPDTSWVSVLSGGAEITCHCRSSDDLVLATMPRSRRIVEITAHRLLRTVVGGGGWARRVSSLTAAEISALRPSDAEQGSSAGPLTAADHRALDVLARDGRAAWTALATATGWSSSAVARRVGELRRDGVLRFHVDVEPWLYGAEQQALLWLTVAPRDLAAAGDELAGQPDIAFAAVTTGATNVVAIAVCAGGDAFYEQVLLPVGAIPGVERIDVAPITRQVSRSATLPAGVVITGARRG